MTWDDRHWGLALKAPNPPEAYSEYLSQSEAAEDAVPIDDLPHKDWLRAK